MRFARRVYLIAAIYGILVLVPGFFMEREAGIAAPPAITHPEFYFGFYGSALVWQFAFLMIARDPVRYRPLMLVTVLEKLAFFLAVLWLWGACRLAVGGPFYGGLIDGALMLLFFIAWIVTGNDSRAARVKAPEGQPPEGVRS